MLPDLQPLYLSIKVACCALLVVLVLGTGLARFMTRYRFPGQDLLDALLVLPLVMPPVVTGYLLLVLLGKRGPVGQFLHSRLELELLFTPAAAVIAAAVVAFPLMYGAMKAAFASYDVHLEEAASAFGASPGRVFWSITLPLCLPGLLAGTLLAFARALGEFGATVMVAGNIPGQTATVPTAIYFAAEGGNLQLAGLYSIMMAVLNLGMVLLLNRINRQRFQVFSAPGPRVLTTAR